MCALCACCGEEGKFATKGTKITNISVLFVHFVARKVSLPQEAQKSQNEFPDLNSLCTKVDQEPMPLT